MNEDEDKNSNKINNIKESINTYLKVIDSKSKSNSNIKSESNSKNNNNNIFTGKQFFDIIKFEDETPPIKILEKKIDDIKITDI